MSGGCSPWTGRGYKSGGWRRAGLLVAHLVALTVLAAITVTVMDRAALAGCGEAAGFVAGTDITDSLRQAVDCGGTVTLPAGTFYLHGPVHLHPHNEVVGAGIDRTVLKANTDPANGQVWPAWGPDGGLPLPADGLVDPDDGICLNHDYCRQVAQMTLDGNWGRATNVLGGTGTLINFVKVTGGACNGIVDYGLGMSLFNSWVLWNGNMPGRSGHCIGAPSDDTGGPGIYIQPWDFTCGEWREGWFVGCDITPTTIAYNTIIMNGSFGLDTQGVGGSYRRDTFAEFHHNQVANGAGGISLYGSARWHVHDNQIHGAWGPSIHTGHPTCEGRSGGRSHTAAVNICADDSQPCDDNASPCPGQLMPPAPWQGNGSVINNNDLSSWYGIALLGTDRNYPSGITVAGNNCAGSAMGSFESHSGPNSWQGNRC